jgi:hypothetical protein
MNWLRMMMLALSLALMGVGHADPRDEKNCPADMSSADDVIVVGYGGDWWGSMCDASPSLCQDGDPDTDSEDPDPCGTCTAEPIGDPADTIAGGCVYPAMLVCPDPDCELDGTAVIVTEFVCSLRSR